MAPVEGKGFAKYEGAIGSVFGWEVGKAFNISSTFVVVKELGEIPLEPKGEVKIAKLGGAFLFFEFEDKAEANRVLKRGFQCFKEKLLHLERWGIEVGCFQKGELTKEVWVRIVGLLLHFWSREVFKKIETTMGVYCSG